MPSNPPLSKAELEVLRVLWTLRQATPRQVFDAYPNGRGVDFATVQTYLRRLEAKGYAKATRRGKVKTLSPCVPPNRVVRRTVEDLLGRLFDGQAVPLMRFLIRDRGVSRQEIAELRQLLDQSSESVE